MQRKCAYTGLEALAKDVHLPKDKAGGEVHSWALEVPCSEAYKRFKGARLPTRLEARAVSLFFEAEVARLNLRRIELEQEAVHARLTQLMDEALAKQAREQRDAEEALAKAERDLQESGSEAVKAVLAEKELETALELEREAEGGGFEW